MDRWRDFTPVPRPKTVRKMADKACYRNALRVVLRHHPQTRGTHAGDLPIYMYAEGLAWSAFGPVHHAWVVNEEGDAIDPTWSEVGSRYYGITFAVGDLPELGGPAIDGRTIADAITEALGSR